MTYVQALTKALEWYFDITDGRPTDEELEAARRLSELRTRLRRLLAEPV